MGNLPYVPSELSNFSRDIMLSAWIRVYLNSHLTLTRRCSSFSRYLPAIGGSAPEWGMGVPHTVGRYCSWYDRHGQSQISRCFRRGQETIGSESIKGEDERFSHTEFIDACVRKGSSVWTTTAHVMSKCCNSDTDKTDSMHDESALYENSLSMSNDGAV
eukprot:3053543-Pleurochrysis_carterae.AAC.1